MFNVLYVSPKPEVLYLKREYSVTIKSKELGPSKRLGR